MKITQSREKPDSGWSWVVVASCCFINAILFGTYRLSGILLVATRNEFAVTRQSASLPYTIGAVMRNLCTPLVGFCGRKFGVRLTTLFGGACAAIGVAICSLATNLTWIMIFWGIGFGSGYGFGNTLLPVSINSYFDRHRATASGISFSGACLGSFVLPPLITFLIDEYSLKGTFLFISALLLHTIPCSMLLRKPTYTIEKQVQKKIEPVPVLELGKLNKTQIDGEDNQPEKSDNMLHKHNVVNAQKCSMNINGDNEEQDEEFKTVKEGLNYCHSNDVPRTSESPLLDILSDSHVHEKENVMKHCFTLCTSPVFIVICISIAVFGYVFTCILTCVIDYAADIGIQDARIQYILMSFSAGDLIGRLGLGWITDRRVMSKNLFCAVLFVLQALASASIAWSTGFCSLMATIFIYGIFEGGLMLIFPLLVADYVDNKLQTLAVPSSNLLCSPLYLLVPVVIGFFRESLGSYDGLFYHACALSSICSALWFCQLLLEKRKNKRKHKA